VLRKYANRILDNSLALYAGFAGLVVLMVAVFIFVNRQTQGYDNVRRFISERQLLYRIYIDLLGAETGQRGYLVTGSRDYLTPYNLAIDRLDGDFKALSDVADGTPGEQDKLAAMRGLADQKIAELRSTLDLSDAGRRDEALALVNGGVGKAVMETFRTRIDELVLLQQQRIDSLFGLLARQGNLLRLGTLTAVLLAVAVGSLSVRRLRRQLARITSARDSLNVANAALVTEAEQRSLLAEQLRQSQKMEGVGQLAGGLAHDFNNMLMVIRGNIDLARRGFKKGAANPERHLDAATEGVERASSLTRRLLAFSRQQPLAPRPIDPNKMVSSMAELLRRTLGEAVQLETVLAGGLWRAHADATELESAILNLALNARDAMQTGGKLTIETSNAFLDDDYAARQIGVPVGQYVLIAITDTGSGMPRDVIEHAFDPFFTTKPPGQGTGLGLSQVYGFVRQSGGHVKIYSELGHGTTVKVYLPRYYGEAETQNPMPRSADSAPVRRHETILFVEDDERVRRLTAETLAELGYRVLQADGAAEALRQLDSHAEVDLLFTDIVMPETDGRKLADEACKRRPSLKVLFTTGYTRNAIVHGGVLDPGVNLIVKPYSIEMLGRKLREVLDLEAKRSIQS
jgi:signal transduction histidine kinase/ActR/RegA family two-component response regulator